MSQVVVSLSDPISTWVNKTNEIAADVGNMAALSDSAATLVAAINAIDSDIGNRANLTFKDGATSIVAAINNLDDRFIELTDSAVIKNYFASTTTISFDSGGGGARGTLTLVDSSVTEAKLGARSVTTSKIGLVAVRSENINNQAVGNAALADSSITFAKIQSAQIKSTHFASSTSLSVKNSAGSTLKTIFGPGV